MQYLALTNLRPAKVSQFLVRFHLFVEIGIVKNPSQTRIFVQTKCSHTIVNTEIRSLAVTTDYAAKLYSYPV